MWLWKNPGLLLEEGKKEEKEKSQGVADAVTGVLWIVLASHIKERWIRMRNRHKEILLITGEWDAHIQRKELILARLNCKVEAGWGLGLLSHSSREWKPNYSTGLFHMEMGWCCL